jgi:hypothetical protein
MFPCDAHLPSSQAIFVRMFNQQQPNIEYRLAEGSFSASFSLNAPSMSTSQSRSSSTTQTTATSQIQGENCFTDFDQAATEDSLLGLLDSVPWSLGHCDSINVVNEYGRNLAHLCAQLGYHRLLIAMIERGVDIHAKDVNGWTPLDFARLHCDNDAVDILEGDWEESVLLTASSSRANDGEVEQDLATATLLKISSHPSEDLKMVKTSNWKRFHQQASACYTKDPPCVQRELIEAVDIEFLPNLTAIFRTKEWIYQSAPIPRQMIIELCSKDPCTEEFRCCFCPDYTFKQSEHAIEHLHRHFGLHPFACTAQNWYDRGLRWRRAVELTIL